jgi:hypothetical protein
VKRLGRALALAAGWVVVPLATVELVMIFFEPVLFRGFYQYDSDLGFRVRPGARGSNEFGFNDRDYPRVVEPGTFRVLVVGDSFAWAGGREGNYTALLEKRFEEHYGEHRVDVINAGYSMTHTGEQLPLLEKFGLLYAPDLVVLGFTAENDFFDATPTRKRIVVNGLYVDIDPRSERSLFGYPLLPTSRLLLFVSQQMRIRSELARGRSETEMLGLPDDQPVFSEETFLHLQGQRMQFCRLSDLRQGVYSANVAYIFRSLQGMKALLDEHGIPLLVVMIPGEFQVDVPLQEKIFARFQLDRSDYDLDCPQKLLTRYMRESGIAYLDLMPEFRRSQQTEMLYVYRDGHWNAAGNRLAAEILFEELRPRVPSEFAVNAPEEPIRTPGLGAAAPAP